MSKVCIVCEKEISGTATKVKNDGAIDTIRKVKNMLKIAKNNELYVCEKDLQIYVERRRKFEKDLVAYGILGIAVVVLLVGIPLLGGKFDIVILIYSIILGTIIFGLGALIKYVPAIENMPKDKVANIKSVKKEEKPKKKVK